MTVPAVRVRVGVRPSWERLAEEVWSWTAGSRRKETGLRELNRPGPFSDEASGVCERERGDERGRDEICGEGFDRGGSYGRESRN